MVRSPRESHVAGRVLFRLLMSSPLVIGRGIAASLMYGAAAVWIGTRFVAAIESGATQASKKA
jgi:hypothetical protein